MIHPTRRTLPSYVISVLRQLNSTRLFANIEYEVDELRRDVTVCKLAKENGMKPMFVHDRCIVEPGVVQTKTEKVYTVGSSLPLVPIYCLYRFAIGIFSIPKKLDFKTQW